MILHLLQTFFFLACRILVEDGTGEAVVLCRNQQVREVLALDPEEWDVVQAHVRSRGFISIQPKESGSSPGGVSGLFILLRQSS